MFHPEGLPPLSPMRQSLCETLDSRTWGGPSDRSRPPGGSCFNTEKPAGRRRRAGSPPHKAVFTQSLTHGLGGASFGSGNIRRPLQFLSCQVEPISAIEKGASLRCSPHIVSQEGKRNY